MKSEHAVSRRATLKGLGAVGAAIALGGPVAAQAPAGAKPAGGGQDKQATSPVDVAAERFAKGHS